MLTKHWIGWRVWIWNNNIYYVYNSNSISWEEVPSRGVVGVVVYLTPPYRKVIDGHDWVWLEGGAFDSVPTHPEWGKWAEMPQVDDRLLKRGAGVPDEPWAEIQREMMQAREAP